MENDKSLSDVHFGGTSYVMVKDIEKIRKVNADVLTLGRLIEMRDRHKSLMGINTEYINGEPVYKVLEKVIDNWEKCWCLM